MPHGLIFLFTYLHHYDDYAVNNLYIQVVTLYRISKADKNHIVPPPPQTDFFDNSIAVLLHFFSF
ncbi:hypothetical protein J2750_002440 [Methanococcoides alaskense]|uniref:Uncharacterized protein n=1 Tax=Methanococcoides alaskense TaxID=325778 RepID=A0AA90U2E0_9EURY|nr:hypothetical protein [Methanococcoides alaskense]